MSRTITVKTNAVKKHFNMAYRHNICGVCEVSRSQVSMVETECEIRNEKHLWTYKDVGLVPAEH